MDRVKVARATGCETASSTEQGARDTSGTARRRPQRRAGALAVRPREKSGNGSERGRACVWLPSIAPRQRVVRRRLEMLQAKKEALENTARRRIVEIREKELQYYTSNCRNIGQCAALVSGLAYSGIRCVLKLRRALSLSPRACPSLVLRFGARFAFSPSSSTPNGSTRLSRLSGTTICSSVRPTTSWASRTAWRRCSSSPSSPSPSAAPCRPSTSRCS